MKISHSIHCCAVCVFYTFMTHEFYVPKRRWMHSHQIIYIHNNNSNKMSSQQKSTLRAFWGNFIRFYFVVADEWFKRIWISDDNYPTQNYCHKTLQNIQKNLSLNGENNKISFNHRPHIIRYVFIMLFWLGAKNATRKNGTYRPAPKKIYVLMFLLNNFFSFMSCRIRQKN